MKQDQYSRWESIKVKAKHDYLCAQCGSDHCVQAHAPGGNHSDWRKGIALCANCHSKEHPKVPIKLFTSLSHQPYWPNISARCLAKEFGLCSRTIIRDAKRLNIPSGIPLSKEDRERLEQDRKPLPDIFQEKT